LACALAVAASLPSSPAATVPDDGKALLIGTDTPTPRVLFRTLDDGPMLWASPGTLGSKLSVEPGHHRLHVTCQFTSEGNTLVTAGNVEFDVEVGHVYDVTAILDQSGQKCDVKVTRR